MSDYKLLRGDCLEKLRELPDNSIDAVVTDPPYGLSKEPDMTEVLRHWLAGDDYVHKGKGFMGKSWDSFVPGPAVWRECLRVLKPGGHLVSFFGTRTYDMGVLAIRLAGFEIRDQLAWVYGGGFPKSMNLDRLKGDRICGCEGSDWAQTERDVRPVREGDVPSAEHTGEECREVLQQGMQEQSAHRSVPGQESCEGCDRIAECGLEGRCYASQAPRELRLGEVHPRAGACAADDAQGRVYHGAPMDHGVLDRSHAPASGGGASHRPQSAEQRQGEPRAVAGQQEPQAVGVWPVCGGCGLPRIPSGLGTALKPAQEPIVLARKPLTGTVAANVLEHGTGALNIDGCRVGTEGGSNQPSGMDRYNARLAEHGYRPDSYQKGEPVPPEPAGRWPANLAHDGSDEVLAAFPDAPGQQRSVGPEHGEKPSVNVYGDYGARDTFNPRGDKGSAARFFYCAKASKRDRNEGCEHLQEGRYSHDGRQTPIDNAFQRNSSNSSNSHPTVKPTDLMRWLVRLVTPPGGTVLDPYTGSGSTGKAAILEGFEFVGIERDADEDGEPLGYIDIAHARIGWAIKQAGAELPPQPESGPLNDPVEPEAPGQRSLFDAFICPEVDHGE